MYEFDDYAYVMHKRDNQISITNYLKANNKWIAKGDNPKYIRTYSETEKIIYENKLIIGEEVIEEKTYAFIVSFIPKYDRVMFLIVSNYELGELKFYNKLDQENHDIPLLYNEDSLDSRDNYYIYGIFLDYEDSKAGYVKIGQRVEGFYQ